VSYVIGFEDEDGVRQDLVGGKGANLGRLVAAGFPVPPGFVITSVAYNRFMSEAGLDQRALGMVAELDFEDADAVAGALGTLREEIESAPMPGEIEAQIRAAYEEQIAGASDDGRVAVRSSGTAEDLAEASFAGLHDTYLDILGAEAAIDAVRRCWASLWTARATTYRENKGFDQGEVSLAVVVQAMVSAEVSGVLFTANPLTTNTGEFVVNASWGLGEAIVSGLVTPDELVLSEATMRVRRRVVADKDKRIVREVGGGTRTEPVPEAERRAPALSDAEAARLGVLGRAVMAHYDGMPQDIEWALADGRFYLLQSRDVTGVDFTWDEDIDASFQGDPEQNDEILWTHQWAREFWNGGLTPLHYSVRARMFELSNRLFRRELGMEEVHDMRLLKYRRGTAYFNTAVDARHYEAILPRALRAAGLGNVHPDDHAAVLAEPFDVKRFIRIMLRMAFLDEGHGVNSWFEVIYPMMEDRRGPGDPRGYGEPPEYFAAVGGLHGRIAAELEGLSDAELKRHTEDRMDVTAYYNVTLWDGFFLYAPITLAGIGWMLSNWLGDDDPATFQSLISGLPIRTKMAEETHDVWHLAQRIKASEALTRLFEENPGAAFFAALEDDEQGREFLVEYRAFVDLHGHRGHADRDFWYDRRAENPVLDYESFRANLKSDESRSPESTETALIENRERTTDRLLAQLRRQPLGFARAKLFAAALNYAHRFLRLRDDERWAIDIMTMSKKRCFEEVSRRLLERGQLEGDRDFYFLSKGRLFDLLESGQPAGRLIRAQIAGRRSAFERALRREDDSPLYLKGDVPLAEESADGDNVLRGVGTSKGEVTATARVIRSLEEIGNVQKGDVLVCNSTDPGWASVFLIINGLIIETGGMLAHGSCLSREYGLPAVTLNGAIRLIPDGATVTVNGDTGEIHLVEEDAEPAPEGDAEPAVA
jgi:pyruvate,water dikinase